MIPRLVVHPGQLSIFCRNEWPTFRVGWPEEGTFHLSTVYRVKVVDYENIGHPNQVPYITIWYYLVERPLSWLKPFILPASLHPAIHPVWQCYPSPSPSLSSSPGHRGGREPHTHSLCPSAGQTTTYDGRRGGGEP